MSLEKNHEIKWVSIETLKPNPKNSNKHSDEQIQRLAKIIKYQGFRSPIVVSNLSGLVVSGHARLEAAKVLGLQKVPVSFQDFEDETQEFAHLNADNEIARWATLDMDIIKGFDFDHGFDMDLLGLQEINILDEQETEEKPKKEKQETFIIEVTCSSKVELNETYEELLSLGLIAKIR